MSTIEKMAKPTMTIARVEGNSGDSATIPEADRGRLACQKTTEKTFGHGGMWKP